MGYTDAETPECDCGVRPKTEDRLHAYQCPVRIAWESKTVTRAEFDALYAEVRAINGHLMTDVWDSILSLHHQRLNALEKGGADAKFDAKAWADNWLAENELGSNWRPQDLAQAAYHAAFAAATERACEMVNRSGENHWVDIKITNEILAELRGTK